MTGLPLDLASATGSKEPLAAGWRQVRSRVTNGPPATFVRMLIRAAMLMAFSSSN